MSRAIYVLIVEQSVDDAERIVPHLQASGFAPSYQRVASAAALTAALAQRRWDVVLSDFALDDFQAITALRQLRQAGYDLPFIVVSGTIGEELAVELMRAGASDFIAKTNLTRLAAVVERELREANSRQQHAADQLRAHHLLRAVADATPDALFVKDEQGRYLLINRAAAEFVGRSVDEVLGKDDTQLFNAADAARIMQRDRRVLATDQTETEEEILTAAGTRRAYLATKAPYRDLQGRVVGVVGISRDITESKQAAESLLMRDRVIQAVTQGILICDHCQPDDPIIYASPGFAQMTGYATSEVLGRNCRFLQGPETDPAAVHELRRALHAGKPCTVELLNYRQDGSTFWNSLSLSPVTDADGQLTHFVGVQTDVTQRRQLEEQFRQSQKMEAIGLLAGGVAHDFNNHLTIISGYTEVLLEGLNSGDPRWEILEEIRQAAERSAALTNQLLAFSRQQALTPQLFCVSTLIDGMEKILRRVLGEHIRLTMELAHDLASVKADPRQLEQALLNLAINARDAMPEGGELRVLARNIQRDDAGNQRFVRLTIMDTGHGMSPEIADRVFEPFFTTKQIGQGTGLGLAVVHGFAQQCGGQISVRSEVGIGTTFYIDLPASEQSPVAKVSSEPAEIPLGAETILLVEDDDNVRMFSQRALEQCGYHVLTARSPADALTLSRSHPSKIDLLVTDVVMPQMNGRRLSELLRQERSQLDVLFMSGYTDDTIMRQGIRSDGIHYLSKPFSLGALAHKVRQVLDHVRPLNPA
ncbi:MAG TPA: PAS domain S-box protein [Pirellulaceae bacterium]|nr:PAS domain S-box protein [Pirellulaceae bacterium]